MSQERSKIRLYRTEGVVLKHREYGEADRIVTMYTPDLGKLVAIAKGVRKPRSRKAGHLEPFTRVEVLLAQGRTWDIITQADSVQTFMHLRENLRMLAYASYFVELVDRFSSEGESNELLYNLLVMALERLDAGDRPEVLARFFEIYVLGLEGYQPQLYRCVSCGAELLPEDGFFSVEMGGVLCPRCGGQTPRAVPLSLNAFKLLRFLQSRSYDKVRALEIGRSTLAETEALLGRYIVHLLEQNLRSTKFLRRLRLQMKSG
jgi:DNA repair protein RecO (recombination protein O)